MAGQRLAPDRAEQLLVLVRDFRQRVVHGVPDRHRSDLAEQDDLAGVAQERVGVAQAVHPGGDGRSRERAFRREAAPHQGVEDGQRQFDGVPVRS
jgi:hypothetical protein